MLKIIPTNAKKKNINILQIVKNQYNIYTQYRRKYTTNSKYVRKYTIRNKYKVINPGYVNVYLQRIFSNV